nr:MAG TPA: hypothetical protein [Caudoviricetes sp.]
MDFQEKCIQIVLAVFVQGVQYALSRRKYAKIVLTFRTKCTIL